jgi:hypothetical protein
MVAHARAGKRADGAETQHHALLVGPHEIDSARQPQRGQRKRDDAERAGGEAAARQEAAQALGAAAKKIVEIGGPRATPRIASPRPSRALRVRTVAALPGIPGHRFNSRFLGFPRPGGYMCKAEQAQTRGAAANRTHQ